MSGQFRGVKARILEMNPKALFVHCVSHNLNLALQEASKRLPPVRDALQVVHDVGKMVRESPHRISCLRKLADLKDIEDYAIPAPLCATRWVAKSKALRQMVQKKQYELIIDTLEELSHEHCGEAGAKAAGLVCNLRKGSTYLGIVVCEAVFSKTELLATKLQSHSMTVAGAKSSAKLLIDALQVIFAS
jgi:hypothetical protein